MDQVEISLHGYATLLVLSDTLLVLSATLLLLLVKRRCPSSPPGPVALPIIGHLHLLGPRLHQTFHDLSLRHGPILHLRLGSVPCAVVSSAELARESLKTHDLVFSSRQNSTAIDIITYGYGSSLAFSPNGPYWRYIKKLCTTELLGPRNLRHFQLVRTSEVKNFLEILMQKGKSGDIVNLTEELLKLTSSVISVMMLGIRLSETEGEAAEGARTVFREVTQIFGEFNISDIVWFCRKFDLQGIKKRALDIHRRYDAFLEKIITDREELRRRHGGGVEASDFLDLFLDIMESGKSEVEFTRKHLKALILDFFTAGTDTTSIATEWAIAELINNPKILKKAQQEIDEVVGSDRLVEESDAPNLPYLMAIIKETFRLHPPIPMITRISSSDCTINGYKVSAKTLLFVNNWSIGRNPEYWKTPLEFLPERFLEEENASVDVKGQHFELLPFGSGRRGCPGMMLALQELVLVLGTMIQCFDWKLPDGVGCGRVDMTERPGLAAPRANELICCVVPRVDPVVVFGH